MSSRYRFSFMIAELRSFLYLVIVIECEGPDFSHMIGKLVTVMNIILDILQLNTFLHPVNN